MVPASRVLDTLSAGKLGKSVVAIWEREPAPPERPVAG
jgi:hypothetical protein